MKKIKTQMSMAAMVAIALIVGGILINLVYSTGNLVSGMNRRESETANKAFAAMFQSYKDVAIERAEMIAGSKDIINAVANGNEAALVSALRNYSVGLDLITLCDAEGIVLARSHNETKGDSVLSQKAISTALSTGRGISTIESGTIIGLSTRGSAAIKDASGRIIGALTCGHDLSQEKYIDAVKQQSGGEAAFFAADKIMSTTLTDTSGKRAVGMQAEADVVETVIKNKREYTGSITLFGSMYQANYSPVIVDNNVIGMLFTGVNVESMTDQGIRMMVLIVVAAVMLFAAVMITLILVRNTANKAYWYESILDSIPYPISVTDNNMNWTFINKAVEVMLNKKRGETMGQHCSNWGAGICNTEKCGINCLNKGIKTTTFEQMGMDFRVDSSYIYDMRGKKAGHIEIVQDVSDMVKTQKMQTAMVEEINSVIGTFISGSKKIADGSQVLAQGSAEQSGAVEQLSDSISTIAQRTKRNAEMAEQAAVLANTIKSNAEKGSGQMAEMMEAVKEINQASQSINKVIKVIDDIAFQTNILALNAAVEAARAGQHGKGFAVVAEEVRNLAAKSAAAAKDTGNLIANSMEKAEFGARIAGETSSSLEDIVSGINESSRLVGEIAQMSEEQTKGILEINKGIEQVAQIVRQNTVTAEESAAASEEMSSHSDMLGRLVEQFTANSDENTGGRKDNQLYESPKKQLVMPEKSTAGYDGGYGKY